MVLHPYKPLFVWIQVLAAPFLGDGILCRDRSFRVSARLNLVGKERREIIGSWHGGLAEWGKAMGKREEKIGILMEGWGRGKVLGGCTWGPCDVDTRRV